MGPDAIGDLVAEEVILSAVAVLAEAPERPALAVHRVHFVGEERRAVVIEDGIARLGRPEGRGGNGGAFGQRWLMPVPSRLVRCRARASSCPPFMGGLPSTALNAPRHCDVKTVIGP